MDLWCCRYTRQMVEPASGSDAAGRFLPHRSPRRHSAVGSTVPCEPRGPIPGAGLRGPSTGPDDPFGPIVLLRLPEQNLGRIIQEGWDYETSVFVRDLETGPW